MTNKISNFVLLFLLFLLQSCSGGKIGNFLETSFMNNNSNKISQNDINKNFKSKIMSEDTKFLRKKDKITKIEINNESKPPNIANSSSIKNNANTIKNQIQNYRPKSYRIFVILKKVDPSFPTENFSKVLRNADINFEIEKIELIPELNQNKK